VVLLSGGRGGCCSAARVEDKEVKAGGAQSGLTQSVDTLTIPLSRDGKEGKARVTNAASNGTSDTLLPPFSLAGTLPTQKWREVCQLACAPARL